MLWIRINEADGPKISIPVPLFLAGSPVALKMMSRYVGQDAAKYAPAAGKIVRELRRYVRKHGHFTLVDIESSDGTCLRITV
jgi:hypothetical protein